MKLTATRRKQRGFVQAYMIAAIAMFSLSAYAMSQMYDANDQVRWRKATSDLLVEQMLLIRKQVIACGTAYPDGINNDAGSLPQYKRYPSSNINLGAVTCPGAPSAEQLTFGGQHGVYLRKLPPEFGIWRYQNSVSGLTVTVRAVQPRGQEVFTSIARRFNPVETSVAGDQLTFVVASP